MTDPPVSIALTVTTPQLVDYLLGSGAYIQQLTANVPGTWAVSAGALPPGLNLDSDTGEITGTPTTAGSFAFTILFTETGTGRTAERQFVIRIGDAFDIVTNTLPDAVEGVAYDASVSAVGGVGAITFDVTAGTPPPGVSLAADGSFSGAPTAAGTYNFTVRATDSGFPSNSVAKNLEIVVSAPGPTDVTASVLEDADPVAAGATLTYTMTLTNLGLSAATGVAATLTLPSSTTFLSADAGCTRSGSIVTCELAALAPSGVNAFDVSVRPDVGGVTLVAAVSVSTTTVDPTPANNTASVSTDVNGVGTRRIEVANAGDATLSTINPDDDSTGSLPIAAPAYDIAFAPNGQRAFVSLPTADVVAVLDSITGANLANLSVEEPVHAEVTPDGARIYVASVAGTVEVFDAVTNAFVTSIAVGAAPNGLAITPDGKRVYVANRSSDSVSVIDTTSNTVITTIALTAGDFPVEVAIAPNGGRAYVTNYFGSSVSVIDTATNTVLTTIVGLAGPQGIAITPNGTKAYVANFDGDFVAVINLATNAIVATPAAVGSPNGVVVNPDGDTVYVTLYNGSALSVLSTATDAEIDSFAFGTFPIAVDYVRRP